jgi:hypothetical protein
MLLTSADELCKNASVTAVLNRQASRPHGSTGARRAPLNKRTDLDVADLPPLLVSPAEAVGRWWLACVRYQHENAVVDALAEQEIVWCMPQTIVTSRKRRVERRVPLFREYVPCCLPAGKYGDEGDSNNLYVRGVHRVIRISDQRRFIQQLSTVYHANKIAPLDPYPYAVEGKACRVARGPFTGFQGIVIRRDFAKPLVVLQVNTMGGASIPFDFDPIDLEPVVD